MKREATFFITTGRSGTQWLATTLGAVYGDLARVEHEPIGYAYRPRLYLRAYDMVKDCRSIPAVASHLVEIQSELEQRSYIEVGFPCFAASPLFYEALQGRIRLVQLVRHPVLAASSLLTHQWYQGTRTEDDLESHIALQPSDPGIYQRHYTNRWASMSAYERCLFYWTEVHQFAQEAHARFHEVPYHIVRFEDLIGRPKEYLKDLVEFLKLPYRDKLLEWVQRRVDVMDRKTRTFVRWRQVYSHPLTLALAEHFGYEVAAIDDWSFLRRYWAGLDPDRVMSAIRRRAAVLVKDVG